MRRREGEAGRLKALIGAFPRSRVTVIGDLIVDHYVWGQVQRISPEAPVPVVEVREENRRLGGAANVAHNIRSLGGRVELVGVAGQDEPGDWLVRELADRGIGTDGVTRQPGRPTSIKTRVIAHHQQVVRFDRETRDHLPPRALASLRAFLTSRLQPGGTVVVSDYGKGAINQPILALLRNMAGDGKLQVLVDPKSRHFHIYRGFSLVTPNLREAELAAGMEITDEESLRRAGLKLLDTLETASLLVTRGEAGMSLFSAGKVMHIPTAAREVFDVTGAGDTVLATLALARSAGASWLEAALLANLAAGVVVGEVGTSTVNRSQLLAAIKEMKPHVPNSRKR